MSKTKLIYSCQHCGAQFPKWVGQCGECGTWNSLVEESFSAPSKLGKGIEKAGARFANYAGIQNNEIVLLPEVKIDVKSRILTELSELDRVLGGGVILGQVTLVGGDPGVGKSTLLLQMLANLSKSHKVVYVTGEESLEQVAMRARRLDLYTDNLKLLSETNVERILELMQKEKPDILVIDSIQTMYTDILNSAPGSVSQVRESAAHLVRFAKQTLTSLFLVGHVTKEGNLAGPRVLEHMVDSVLYFEGERGGKYRMVRAVKNRFGAVNELGVFAMTDKGLREISNPSAIFLSRYAKAVSGSTVLVTWEGSRPILVEVQALVDDTPLANPRRVTVGLEQNRLSMLLAVLHRHTGVVTYNQDVFVNVVGGIRVIETGADLALILAVISSLRNKPLPLDLALFGEVGLSGEIRPVPSGQERLKAAAKHGFKRAIVPLGNMAKNMPDGIEVLPAQNLSAVLKIVGNL